MLGTVYNTDYGWMVKELDSFETYLPLHPDTNESYLVEGMRIKYNVSVFGISDVAVVSKKMYTNEDCEEIGLNGRLEGLRSYLEHLLVIRSNPMYKGDLAQEINRVNAEIRETELKKDNIKKRNE